MTKKTPGATRPEEMAMVLDSLTPESLVTFVAEKSKAQDIPWLRAMLDNGYFDSPDDLGMCDIAFQDHTRHDAGGFAVFGALATVAESSKAPGTDEDSLPSLEVSDAFKAFFMEAILQFSQTCQEKLKNRSLIPLQKELARDMVTLTFAPLLAAACAMDHSEAVTHLVKAMPKAADGWVDCRFFGDAGRSMMRGEGNPQFNAAFAATCFSSHSALDALQSNLAQFSPATASHSALAKIKVPQGQAVFDVDDPRVGTLDAKRIGLLPFLLSRGLKCDADMLARSILALQVNGDFIHNDAQRFYSMATTALNTYVPTSSSVMIQGYLQAGVYDLHPAWSIKNAAASVCAPVMAHFADRMPWAELLDATTETVFQSIMQSAEAQKKPLPCERRVVELMLHAKKEGFGDQVFGPQAQEHPGMVKTLIKKKFHQILLCHMEHGLDPHRPLEKKLSALDMAAKEKNEAAAHLMHSYVARQFAKNIMDDLNEPARSPAP